MVYLDRSEIGDTFHAPLPVETAMLQRANGQQTQTVPHGGLLIEEQRTAGVLTGLTALFNGRIVDRLPVKRSAIAGNPDALRGMFEREVRRRLHLDGGGEGR